MYLRYYGPISAVCCSGLFPWTCQMWILKAYFTNAHVLNVKYLLVIDLVNNFSLDAE